jgi:hypothetical protein
MLERDLERLFVKQVRAAGGITIKISPVTAGVPDRMVLTSGGRILLVELKTSKGKLSPMQIHWHRKAAKLDVPIAVLHGPSEVKKWIADTFASYS